jgi:subtilisin family serine protease
MIKKNMYQGRALKVIFGIMIVAFLLVGCAAAAQPAGTESYHGKQAAANQVLVKFHAATPQAINIIKIKEDVDEAEPVGSAGAIRLHSKSKNIDTLISDLSARADVEYAEPDYIIYATAIPNDPSYGNLWGLTKISAPSAWDISTGSNAYVAGVIDTGIDYNHPDLAANVWSAPAAYTVTIGGRSITCPAGSHGFNAILNTCDPMDDNSHGSHVSGTIGAVGNNGAGVAGVNWNTKIIAAKFLNKQGSGTTSNAINAIDFVIQTKSRFESAADVRVLSNSWAGGGFSQSLLDEIDKANTNDMLFVAAASNDGKNNDITPSYPANYEVANVVSVAAIDSTDSLASWLNYGKTTVDLAAPGVSILSTIRNGGYAYYSGTSMATPHVSGAALLILSACSNLDTAELKADILDNVDPVTSLDGKTVTGGRLDVNKAIRACSAPVTPISTSTTLSASPASSIYGGQVTFTATVTASGDFGTPTGIVTFYDGTTSLGTAPLSSGSASFSTANLAVAIHTIKATYNGNSNYIASTSDALLYTVESATSAGFSLSATPSSRSVNSGSSTTYTVSITRSLGFTGSVALSVSGLPSGASGTFSPNPATSTSSTLTVKTKPSTPTGNFPLTIKGTDNSGSITRTTTVTLTVIKLRGR